MVSRVQGELTGPGSGRAAAAQQRTWANTSRDVLRTAKHSLNNMAADVWSRVIPFSSDIVRKLSQTSKACRWAVNRAQHKLCATHPTPLFLCHVGGEPWDGSTSAAINQRIARMNKCGRLAAPWIWRRENFLEERPPLRAEGWDLYSFCKLERAILQKYDLHLIEMFERLAPISKVSENSDQPLSPGSASIDNKQSVMVAAEVKNAPPAIKPSPLQDFIKSLTGTPEQRAKKIRDKLRGEWNQKIEALDNEWLQAKIFPPEIVHLLLKPADLEQIIYFSVSIKGTGSPELFCALLKKTEIANETRIFYLRMAISFGLRSAIEPLFYSFRTSQDPRLQLTIDPRYLALSAPEILRLRSHSPRFSRWIWNHSGICLNSVTTYLSHYLPASNAEEFCLQLIHNLSQDRVQRLFLRAWNRGDDKVSNAFLKMRGKDLSASTLITALCIVSEGKEVLLRVGLFVASAYFGRHASWGLWGLSLSGSFYKASIKNFRRGVQSLWWSVQENPKEIAAQHRQIASQVAQVVKLLWDKGLGLFRNSGFVDFSGK